MMIDDEFPFENILKTFSNYNRTLQGSGGFPPNRSLFCLMLSTICSDYCDLPLGSYKKKSQEEPRQDLWSSRKKISIDHVAPQVGQKYQTMIEHMYTVLTWNTYSLFLAREEKCATDRAFVYFTYSDTLALANWIQTAYCLLSITWSSDVHRSYKSINYDLYFILLYYLKLHMTYNL